MPRKKLPPKTEEEPLVPFKARDLQDQDSIARAVHEKLQDPAMHDAALPREDVSFDDIVETLLKEQK